MLSTLRALPSLDLKTALEEHVFITPTLQLGKPRHSDDLQPSSLSSQKIPQGVLLITREKGCRRELRVWGSGEHFWGRQP